MIYISPIGTWESFIDLPFSRLVSEWIHRTSLTIQRRCQSTQSAKQWSYYEGWWSPCITSPTRFPVPRLSRRWANNQRRWCTSRPCERQIQDYDARTSSAYLLRLENLRRKREPSEEWFKPPTTRGRWERAEPLAPMSPAPTRRWPAWPHLRKAPASAERESPSSYAGMRSREPCGWRETPLSWRGRPKLTPSASGTRSTPVRGGPRSSRPPGPKRWPNDERRAN